MKEKVKVKNVWAFRMFIIQILSVALSIILTGAKMFGMMDITWFQVFIPTIATIIIPMVAILSGMFILVLMFWIIYVFMNKERKKKMREGFKMISWKRSK